MDDKDIFDNDFEEERVSFDASRLILPLWKPPVRARLSSRILRFSTSKAYSEILL